LSSLIIINGDEEFLKERAALDEARSSLVDFVYQYDQKDLDKYKEESEVPLMFGGSRAFIVWNCVEIPPLPDNDDTLIVVSEKHPLEDSRAKRIRHFPKFKEYGDNNQIIQWIVDEGAVLNIDLSRIATALFVNNGRSLRKISSEIQKLAVLTPEGSEVTPEIAKSVMCFSATLSPRDVVDAICVGDTSRAMTYYDKLQEKADETGWIIAYLQRHVLQQIRIERLVAQKLSHNDMAKELGVHPFVFRKIIFPRTDLWSHPSLVSSLDALCDLDVAHKQGKQSSHFGLELEIIRLSEEAKKNVNRYRGS
jgi:DNA polymerase III delta subunit